MPADALAPKVVSGSAGTVLAVWDRQHVLLFQSKFHSLGSSQIHGRIRILSVSFIIFKTTQHVKR